jgi:predicted GIY-YIG superfamily endonuclease
MVYVYCLVSLGNASKRSIGFTENLRQRVADHNQGANPSTRVERPWRLPFRSTDKNASFHLPPLGRFRRAGISLRDWRVP